MEASTPARLHTLRRHADGKTFRMEALDAQTIDRAENLAEDIYQNCHQGPIWERIFSVFFPQGYQLSDARDYLQICRGSWESGKSFPYGLFDGRQLVGACDIKEKNESNKAEIGYWLNAAHSGIMTNAVNILLQEARRTGYAGLFAYTALTNDKSAAVLRRTGFQITGQIILERRGASFPVNVHVQDF